MTVTLHSTGCPKCKILEAKLKAQGVDYVKNEDVDIMKSLSLKEVPYLQVEDKLIPFVTANKLINKYRKEKSFDEYILENLGE